VPWRIAHRGFLLLVNLPRVFLTHVRKTDKRVSHLVLDGRQESSDPYTLSSNSLCDLSFSLYTTRDYTSFIDRAIASSYMLQTTMCLILPPYTLVPLHSLDRLICLVHQVEDVRRVHHVTPTLAHLARACIAELSAAHGTLQSSATAAGRFYPYSQLHRHTMSISRSGNGTRLEYLGQ
jgi:hypothetical protein